MISKEEKMIAGIIPYGREPAAHDHSIRPNWTDLAINYNSAPCNIDTAIIVTAWFGQRPFLRPTLESMRLTGKFVICAYDPPVHAWSGDKDFREKMPPYDLFLIPHCWVHKHVTFDNPKRVGWFWDVRYAQGIIKSFPQFEYVFTVNGDCPWEKPEKVNDLIAYMGDNDVMAVTAEPNKIHTCAVLYRIEAFNAIVDYMYEYHKVPIPGSYSPENIFTEAIRKLNLKEKVVEKQPMEPGDGSVDHYSRYNQPNTWNDIVGYRNIGAEFITAVVERFEPPEKKFIDFRFFDDVMTQYHGHLLKYYETGDKRYLHMCWDYNEESWYDRLHYPLEYYGDEPILEGGDGRDGRRQI